MAQFDYFIKIDQIPGESTDEKHKDEIEVIEYKFGMEHGDTGSTSTGGARTGGRIRHAPFVFTKVTDKASPKLLEKACDGTHIPKAVFTAHRATGQKQKYLEVQLTDLIVSSWQTKQEAASERGAGSSDGAGVMLQLEEVALNYATIKFIYTLTDHNTGKPAGDIQAGWDLSKNKKL
ncbi:MAG TPA: type VI secretion system tube protein Hcp [Bryobacteraceae bacterium]|nr:type VI secretion system tube protein Hcp [Bryobacteraceae bacterium]